MKTYRVTTPFCCGALTTEKNKVIKKGTAPIYKKYVGKTLNYTQRRLAHKYGEVTTEEL